MTSYSVEDSCILFCNIRSIEKHLRSTSFCIQPVRKLLGASGSIGVAVQNSWVVELWLLNHFTFCWWMWLFSGAPEDPEDETVTEMHRANALYSAVKSLMHAIWTEDQDAQQDAAHWMIQIAKPWTIRRWSESKLANGKPLVQIRMEIALVVDLERNEDEQAKLKNHVERYSSQGASGAWRVHGWRLACFTLVLGDTADWNDISGQWYIEWPLDTSVDSPIFWWRRDTSLPMLVNGSAEYPEPDKDEASNEALLHEPESLKSTLACALPSQMAVLFCPLPGRVRHLKWWLTKFFVDNLDIFYTSAKCKSVRKQHTILPDTQGDLTSPSKYF